MLADGGASEPEALEALLEISDSVMTYRSRYCSRFQLGAVLDLMICDETNPRSIAYQLVECASHAAELPHESVGAGHMRRMRLAASLLQLDSPHRHPPRSPASTKRRRRAARHAAGDIDATLPELTDVISHRYFFHAAPIQRLAEELELAANELEADDRHCMKYTITHKTWYAYTEPAPVCHNLVHLAPRDDAAAGLPRLPPADRPRARVHHRGATTTSAIVEYFSIEGAHHRLEVTAESTVEVRRRRRS